MRQVGKKQSENPLQRLRDVTLDFLPDIAENAAAWLPTLQKLNFAEMDEGRGTLLVTSRATKSLAAVQQNFSQQLQAALDKATESLRMQRLRLEFPVPKQTPAGPAKAPEPLESLRPHLSFDHLIVGSANRQCVQGAKALVQHQDPEQQGALWPSRMLSLHGPAGVGKSHILNAMGLEYLQANPRASVLQVHAHTMLEELMAAFRHSAVGGWRERYRRHDLLLVDGADILIGKERTEEEFYNLLRHVLEERSQGLVALSFQKRPTDLKMLPALFNLMRQNPLYEIYYPCPEMVTEATQRVLGAGRKLPAPGVRMLASLLSGQPFAPLVGVLRRLDAEFRSGELQPRSMTEEKVRAVVREQCGILSSSVTIEDILRVVAEYYKMDEQDICGSSRVRRVMQPRQLVMYLSRELTQESFPRIGEVLGGRCHTTVMSSYKSCKKRMEDDENFRLDCESIKRRLLGRGDGDSDADPADADAE